jgi:hypothetical protein
MFPVCLLILNVWNDRQLLHNLCHIHIHTSHRKFERSSGNRSRTLSEFVSIDRIRPAWKMNTIIFDLVIRWHAAAATRPADQQRTTHQYNTNRQLWTEWHYTFLPMSLATDNRNVQATWYWQWLLVQELPARTGYMLLTVTTGKGTTGTYRLHVTDSDYW